MLGCKGISALIGYCKYRHQKTIFLLKLSAVIICRNRWITHYFSYWIKRITDLINEYLLTWKHSPRRVLEIDLDFKTLYHVTLKFAHLLVCIYLEVITRCLEKILLTFKFKLSKCLFFTQSIYRLKTQMKYLLNRIMI